MNHSNYKIEIDTQVHTVFSGLIYSTPFEYAERAKLCGLKGLCLADSGPFGIGSLSWRSIHGQKLLPKEHEGVKVFKGVEADIVSYDGSLNIGRKSLKGFDICIASIHSTVLNGEDIERNTEAYINALRNPYVDIAGHINSAVVACDLEAVIKEAAGLNKLIEINNNAIRFNLRAAAYKFATLCKKHSVRLCVSSDSRWHGMLGDIDWAASLLAEVDYPIDLVVNRGLGSFQEYLGSRSRMRM